MKNKYQRTPEEKIKAGALTFLILSILILVEFKPVENAENWNAIYPVLNGFMIVCIPVVLLVFTFYVKGRNVFQRKLSN
jgi:hypothetical protein